MAHKLVPIPTTALVLAVVLTLPGTAGAASLQSKGATGNHPSWSWLTQPWLDILARVLPGGLERSIGRQESTTPPGGGTTNDILPPCAPLLPPITSTVEKGSACDPNG